MDDYATIRNCVIGLSVGLAWTWYLVSDHKYRLQNQEAVKKRRNKASNLSGSGAGDDIVRRDS